MLRSLIHTGTCDNNNSPGGVRNKSCRSTVHFPCVLSSLARSQRHASPGQTPQRLKELITPVGDCSGCPPVSSRMAVYCVATAGHVLAIVKPRFLCLLYLHKYLIFVCCHASRAVLFGTPIYVATNTFNSRNSHSRAMILCGSNNKVGNCNSALRKTDSVSANIFMGTRQQFFMLPLFITLQNNTRILVLLVINLIH